MRKSTIITVIIVIVVIGAGVGAFLATQGSNSTPTTSTSSTTPSTKDSTTDNTSQSQTSTANQVNIQNFSFSPADITVKKGTAVTWTNNDSTSHTVTETDGKAGPDSGTLESGKSYTFTFNTVGTFKYRCNFHPEMVGTVTVTE